MERRQHCKPVPLADALNFAERTFVMPANQEHFAIVFQNCELANDFYSVGLAECEIEDDHLGRRGPELGQHRGGGRKRESVVADAGKNKANRRPRSALARLRETSYPPPWSWVPIEFPA